MVAAGVCVTTGWVAGGAVTTVALAATVDVVDALIVAVVIVVVVIVVAVIVGAEAVVAAVLIGTALVVVGWTTTDWGFPLQPTKKQIVSASMAPKRRFTGSFDAGVTPAARKKTIRDNKDQKGAPIRPEFPPPSDDITGEW